MSQLLQQIADNYGFTLERASAAQLSELLSAMALELEVRNRDQGTDSKVMQTLIEQITQAPDYQLIDIAVLVCARMRFGNQMQLDNEFLTDEYVLD
jgi:hypothetical protein